MEIVLNWVGPDLLAWILDMLYTFFLKRSEGMLKNLVDEGFVCCEGLKGYSEEKQANRVGLIQS